MARVAFLFPGQGAQYVGMGKELCEKYPRARKIFELADQIVGFNLSEICFEGPKEKLDATDVSQPAIYVASWAALECLREENVELVDSCEATAGLSLGEYTALAFAGAMKFEEGLRVVQFRGRFMQMAADATPSGMASILGVEREAVAPWCDTESQVWMANYLCPGNTAISGEKEALERVCRLAESDGAKVTQLAVAGAFHTEIMKPAEDKLKRALSLIALDYPVLDVIANVDAQPHEEPDDTREKLVNQLSMPVLWQECMERLIAEGCDQFYEIGPGRVLRGLLRRVDRKLSCENISA